MDGKGKPSGVAYLAARFGLQITTGMPNKWIETLESTYDDIGELADGN
jgi:hypothetical protein